jgi:hypothetical protein
MAPLHLPKWPPPGAVWLAIADLGRVPADWRDTCADTLEDRITNALGLWEAFGDLMPRAEVLRELAASHARAADASEAVFPHPQLPGLGELGPLSGEMGLTPVALAERLREHAAFSRLLVAAADRIAPRSPHGRHPDLRNRLGALSIGEVVLCTLRETVAEFGGKKLGFNRKDTAKGASTGRLLEAWRLLAPHLPSGVDLPGRPRQRAHSRIDHLRQCRIFTPEQ